MKNYSLIIATFVALSVISLPTMAKGKMNADSLSLQNCKLEIKDKNATVSLSYPQIVSGGQGELKAPIAQSINRTVFQTLVKNAPVEYKEKVTNSATLELFCRAVAAELASYGAQRTLEPIPLDFYSTWWAFGNKYVVTIFIETYTFTGGAHGNTKGTLLNFNAQTGEPITQLDVDTAQLLNMAAIQFCRERRLPKNALKIQTGLFCELADLPMPQQMGFNDKGLLLYYNQYEIAPYVFGQITITIPYKDFKNLIADDFTMSVMRSGDGRLYNQKLKEQQRSGRTSKY